MFMIESQRRLKTMITAGWEFLSHYGDHAPHYTGDKAWKITFMRNNASHTAYAKDIDDALELAYNSAIN